MTDSYRDMPPPVLRPQAEHVSSPVGLIVVGVVVSALALLATVVPDAPHAFVVGCWFAIGLGGLIAHVGVVAAGVEHGLRRVRDL